MKKQAIRLPSGRHMRRLGLRLSGLLAGRDASRNWASRVMSNAGTSAAKAIARPVASVGNAARSALANRGFDRTANAVGGLFDFVSGTGKYVAQKGRDNRFFTQGLPNMFGRAGSFIGSGTTYTLPATALSGAVAAPSLFSQEKSSAEIYLMNKQAIPLRNIGRTAWGLLMGGGRVGGGIARRAGALAERATNKAFRGGAEGLAKRMNSYVAKREFMGRGSPTSLLSQAADFVGGNGRFALNPNRRINGVLSGGIGKVMNRGVRLGTGTALAGGSLVGTEHLLNTAVAPPPQ